jgi:hypothetical protein
MVGGFRGGGVQEGSVGAWSWEACCGHRALSAQEAPQPRARARVGAAPEPAPGAARAHLEPPPPLPPPDPDVHAPAGHDLRRRARPALCAAAANLEQGPLRGGGGGAGRRGAGGRRPPARPRGGRGAGDGGVSGALFRGTPAVASNSALSEPRRGARMRLLPPAPRARAPTTESLPCLSPSPLLPPPAASRRLTPSCPPPNAALARRRCWGTLTQRWRAWRARWGPTTCLCPARGATARSWPCWPAREAAAGARGKGARFE